MTDPIKEELWRLLVEARLAFPMESYFTWDSRFGTALLRLTLPSDEIGQSQNRLAELLSDSQSDGTPAAHLSVEKHLGGVHGGQSLYTKRVGENFVIYAAYWPWSDASQISVRVGVLPLPKANLSADECGALLMDIFAKHHL